MKPTMTGFLDFHQTRSLEDQLTIAEQLGIKAIAIRSDGDKPLVEVSDARFRAFVKTLKTMKMKVSFIDPMIESWALDNDKAHGIILKTFEYVLALTEPAKAPYILIPLPLHQDVIKEFDSIKSWLDPLLNLAARYGRKIVLKPTGPMKANSYAYVLKQMRNGIEGIIFDPVHLLNNQESTTTAYRLYRNDIIGVMAQDSTTAGHPKLMGYGQTDILTIFKKMIRDKYQGMLVLDTHFDLFTDEEQEEPKSFFKKLFSNEKKKKATAMAELSSFVFPGGPVKEVTDYDIISNQVKVLNIIFMK